MKNFRWNGPEVQARVHGAVVRAVNETMGDCVTSAKELVHVDTSALQGSIRFEPAHSQGDKVVGHWGSFDIKYALWQEVLPEGRGGKAYLRPSADEHYPELKKKIAEAMHG